VLPGIAGYCVRVRVKLGSIRVRVSALTCRVHCRYRYLAQARAPALALIFPPLILAQKDKKLYQKRWKLG
jgi:hypothetical protein